MGSFNLTELFAYNGGSTNRNFEFFIYQDTNRLALRITNGTNSQIAVNSSFIVSNNTWTFVAARYAKGKPIQLTVNNMTFNTTPSFDLKMTSRALYIGSLSAGQYSPFNGTIDEVMVFNSTLSDEQLNLIYTNKTNVIHSSTTEIGEVWKAEIAPNDGNRDGEIKMSNTLTIVAG